MIRRVLANQTTSLKRLFSKQTQAKKLQLLEQISKAKIELQKLETMIRDQNEFVQRKQIHQQYIDDLHNREAEKQRKIKLKKLQEQKKAAEAQSNSFKQAAGVYNPFLL